jgi:uncharacterized protein (DUF2235 family)
VGKCLRGTARARVLRNAHTAAQGITTMPKTIIFCADGTWNGPGEDVGELGAASSNVLKLYLSLAGDDVNDDMSSFRTADEQERSLLNTAGECIQIAKYLHGVGDTRNWLAKLIGGSTGAGLITRIVRGYTFLSRNYVPGDRIVLVGFSRGAYTARALGGMVATQGLMDPEQSNLADKDIAYRLGSAVWADYRRRKSASDPSAAARLESVLNDLPGFFTNAAAIPMVGPISLACIAVWDTVGALGIPVYNMNSERIDLFQFADTALSSAVQTGLHAVAVDEQRADFSPTLWNLDPGRIVQMVFPGAHADVGGGYPQGAESGLSDGSLQWMCEQLAAQGVLFRPTPLAGLAPNPLGPAHQPWTEPVWRFAPHALRNTIQGLPPHASFTQRLGQLVQADPQLPPAPYAPPNMG